MVQVTRRALLYGSTAVMAGGALGGCTFFNTEPDSGGTGPAGDDGALEAPSLQQKVEAGELPELSERLPKEPMVVEPLNELGQYGGAWRTYAMGPDDNNAYNPIGYEGLVRWIPDYTGATGTDEILPNLAEYEANEDGTVYTFQLRQGVRWSDGEPFDADDIMFWYESVFSNDTLTSGAPAWLSSGGERVVVDKVDDHTVTFTFSTPSAFFLHSMAQLGQGVDIVTYPRHYMSQFHPDHNDDLDQLVEESGQTDWVALFEDRAQWRYNPDLPRLSAWTITTPGSSGTKAVATRNPYYWKVDPEGRQLPYLDEVQYSLVEDPEVALLRALNGEVDLEHRHIATGANYPVLAEGAEEGDYWLMNYSYDSMNIALIQLNLTHADPTKRKIYNNKEFRIGLSLAINRQEVIDLLYNGQGEPWQAGPLKESALYHEQLATQFLDFDVDLANQHLDDAGYSERDADGIRLGPDGKPIVITLDTRSDVFNWTDLAELLTDYWAAVGIDTQVNTASHELIIERRESNQHDAAFESGLGGRAAVLVPRNYVPIESTAGYGLQWARWYQGLPDGEEPPEHIRPMFDLWDQVKTTFDGAEQERLFTQILDIAAEEFLQIGIATPAPEFAVVKNSMRNLPEDGMPSGTPYPNPAPYNPEQFFKVE